MIFLTILEIFSEELANFRTSHPSKNAHSYWAGPPHWDPIYSDAPGNIGMNPSIVQVFLAQVRPWAGRILTVENFDGNYIISPLPWVIYLKKRGAGGFA